MSDKKLDIYNISFDLFIETHRLSLQLPKYELYELVSQLRRSSDSVNSNIAEGYGRRQHKADYIRFLVFSHSSCDETTNNILKITRLYPDSTQFNEILEKYSLLGGKLHNYIEYVRANWRA